jgi:hypothetical protein
MTTLSRHIKRIQLSILTVEKSIADINVSIQAYNSGAQLLGVGSNISTVPTRAQVINYLARETGLDNAEDPEALVAAKKVLTDALDKTIKQIESFGDKIKPIEDRYNEALTYIDIGKKLIGFFQILANLFRILIQGLYLALAPLVSLLASEIIGQKIGEIINKIKAWVMKTFNKIDTWVKWVSDFVDKVMRSIGSAIQSVFTFIRSLIRKLRKIKDFINSIGLALLKALLGIIPKDKNQILQEYADEVDNNPDPDVDGTPDDDSSLPNGDTEDITEIISNNDGRGDLPPDYYSGINLNQITQLKFILEKQQNKNNQSDIEYRRNFINNLPIGDVLEEINNAAEQINNNISSLREEDSEYLSLLEAYGIEIPTQQSMEKVYSIDEQINSLEKAEAELRRRTLQNLSDNNIQGNAEYEEYGKNKNNANVTYTRKSL